MLISPQSDAWMYARPYLNGFMVKTQQITVWRLAHPVHMGIMTQEFASTLVYFRTPNSHGKTPSIISVLLFVLFIILRTIVLSHALLIAPLGSLLTTQRAGVW